MQRSKPWSGIPLSKDTYKHSSANDYGHLWIARDGRSVSLRSDARQLRQADHLTGFGIDIDFVVTGPGGKSGHGAHLA